MKSITYFGYLLLALSHFGGLRAETVQDCDETCLNQYNTCIEHPNIDNIPNGCKANLTDCEENCRHP